MARQTILTPRTNIDVHAVIHVGTPLSGPPETVLDGAVRGTKNVLQHAARAGVARIVVTGSVASMAKYEDFWADRLITEQDWNPETYADAFRADKGFFTTYSVAKMLAERELHAFAAQHPRIAITSILPPFIYGPFGPGQSTDLDSFWRLSSNGFLYALISGPPGRAVAAQYPVYPAFVHVGDLARAHVAALRTAPPREGTVQRVIVSGGAFTWADAVRHIARVRPALRARLPRLPEATEAGTEAKEGVCARLAVNAEECLGVREYKGWKETVEETIDDLLRVEKELGLAP
ncbi:NAD(P)-binding protein [Dentipellis sp. KUC8613]|nr:NAD(P)-binding protein [Dentipellis sp. KUC8613]